MIIKYQLQNVYKKYISAKGCMLKIKNGNEKSIVFSSDILYRF